MFDQHSDAYEREVDLAIAFSGKSQVYFVARRVTHICAAVREAVGEPALLRALEVGCGIGVMQRLLASRCAHYCGVDSSIASLLKCGTDSGATRIAAADGVKLPFADDSFDLTAAACVLHHVVPTLRSVFLAEMARVTRPGGAVVICEHNPWNPLTRLAVSRCIFDADVQLLTASRAVALLRAAGLRQLRRRFILFFPWRAAAWERAEGKLAGVPLGGQYIALGIKV